MSDTIPTTPASEPTPMGAAQEAITADLQALLAEVEATPCECIQPRAAALDPSLTTCQGECSRLVDVRVRLHAPALHLYNRPLGSELSPADMAALLDSWELKTGLPCYDTDHRGYWGAGVVSADDASRDMAALAKDLLEEALEALSHFFTLPSED